MSDDTSLKPYGGFSPGRKRPSELLNINKPPSDPTLGSFATTGDGCWVGIGAVVWRCDPAEPRLIEGMTVYQIEGDASHPTITGHAPGGAIVDRASPSNWYSTPAAALRAAGGAK